MMLDLTIVPGLNYDTINLKRDEWFATLDKHSVETYRPVIESWKCWIAENPTIPGHETRDVLRAYLQYLRNRGMKSNSIKTYAFILQSFYRIVLNVKTPFGAIMENMDIVGHDPVKRHSLTNEQIKILWDSIEIFKRKTVIGQCRLSMAFQILMGLRVAEVASITPESIVNDMLTIVGKGKKQRILPVHPLILELLKSVPIKNQKPIMGASTKGIVFRYDCLKRHTGIIFSSHDFRRYFATKSASNPTVNILALQQTLGHSQLSTTQIYVTESLSVNRELSPIFKNDTANFLKG